MNYRNGPRNIALACLVIALIGLLMILYPLLSGMDGFKGGYALIFGGIIVALSFLISALVFSGQARQLSAAIGSHDTLAQWSYSKDEWKKYYEIEYTRDKKSKRMLFFVASGFAVIFGVLFLIFAKEPAGALYGSAGVIALTGFLQWFAPWLTYRRNRKYAGAALISPLGLYLNGMWYPNKKYGRIDSVGFIDKGRTIKFEWSQLMMQAKGAAGRNRQTIRVPVPHGQEQVAEKVVAFFNNGARSAA